MKRRKLLHLVIVWLAMSTSASYATNLEIEIKVKRAGEIDVVGVVSVQGSSTNNAALSLLPLPFSLRPNVKFETAQDVTVSIASSGNGYTVLSLISEVSGSPVSFGIKNGLSFSETSEGKAKLEMFPGFKYMTKVERDLLAQSIAIKNLDITIQLPKKYDSTEITFRPLSVNTSDDQRFSFPRVTVPDLSGDEYWFVFPNPATEDLKWAQIVISFLLGLFTILFHLSALKKRNLNWQIVVFVLSSIVLVTSVYYSFTLAKKLDFGLFIAASIPHVVFGLLATLWLLLTKRIRVLISGTVHKSDGVPVLLATITLERKKGDAFVPVGSTNQLKENGRYSFTTLLFKETLGTYRVKVQMGAKQETTDEFELSRKDTKEVPNIVLIVE